MPVPAYSDDASEVPTIIWGCPQEVNVGLKTVRLGGMLRQQPSRHLRRHLPVHRWHEVDGPHLRVNIFVPPRLTIERH